MPECRGIRMESCTSFPTFRHVFDLLSARSTQYNIFHNMKTVNINEVKRQSSEKITVAHKKKGTVEDTAAFC